MLSEFEVGGGAGCSGLGVTEAAAMGKMKSVKRPMTKAWVSRVLIVLLCSLGPLGCRSPQESVGIVDNVRVVETQNARNRVQTFWRGENQISRVVSKKIDEEWRVQWQTFYIDGAPVITHFYRDSDGEIEEIGLGHGKTYELFESVDGRFVPVTEEERDAAKAARTQGAEAAERIWKWIDSGAMTESNVVPREVIGDTTSESQDNKAGDSPE